MPKLADLISDGSIETFKKYAVDVAAEMENPKSPDNSRAKYSMYQLINNQPDVSEQVVRVIWNEMWKHAVPKPGLPGGYTHIVYYDHTVTPILRRMFGDFDEAMEGERAGYQADAIRRILMRNRIAVTGKGRGKIPMFTRFWSSSEHIVMDRLGDAYKEGFRELRREAEEKKKAEKKVVVKVDPSLIAPPEPTPEGMVKWAKDMIGSYRAMAEKYEKLNERHNALMERAAGLETEVEKYSSRAQYGDAAEEIAKMLRGENGAA